MASSTARAQGASEESFEEQRRLYNSTMCSVAGEEKKIMREGEKERKVSRLRKFNWYEKKISFARWLGSFPDAFGSCLIRIRNLLNESSAKRIKNLVRQTRTNTQWPRLGQHKRRGRDNTAREEDTARANRSIRRSNNARSKKC